MRSAELSIIVIICGNTMTLCNGARLNRDSYTFGIACLPKVCHEWAAQTFKLPNCARLTSRHNCPQLWHKFANACLQEHVRDRRQADESSYMKFVTHFVNDSRAHSPYSYARQSQLLTFKFVTSWKITLLLTKY
ncbi:hypothetical protein V1527DRAFT_463432 [Lipomyces starkeyi]